MKKVKLVTFVSFILAFILGVWGQGIAYFLRDSIVDILPIYYLTAITIISIILFIISFFLTFYLYETDNKKALLYQLVILIVGGLTSFWSLFVLIMWWG